MRIKLKLTAIAFSLLLQFACSQKTPTDLTKTAFIPMPVNVTATGDSFIMKESTVVYFQNGDERLQKHAAYLVSELNHISGFSLRTIATKEIPSKGIYLSVSKDNELGDEGYELNISKKIVSISASKPAGCFYGIQTLLQTLPVKASEHKLEIASGVIRDFPEYGFRGAMLDVSRHFFDVEEVKQFIDFLAAYKMNILHLHLSDDQGWRIEIKSRPKLTEIGGSTEVGGGNGGFYTQEQYAELVNYAMDRQITIIPEIDMPGHTNAALASYAELNCDGIARELYTGTKVGFSTLCIGKEYTYKFIDDVIRELAEITPGPYIHIGGDESHSTPIEEYIPFVNRVQEIVLKYGKRVIGWDEIANATPAEGAVVQYWDNVANSTMGIEKGAKVIMSPARYAYLDLKYDSTTVLGLNWAGYIEVDRGYSWDPAKMVQGISKEKILGIEAPLWSETVSNINEVEYLVFPRLPGYAEIGWTSPDKRSWDEYKIRLAKHGKRFDDLDINYYRSNRVMWDVN